MGKSPIHKEIISTVFKSLEVFRRFIWNFFRLENEHLNNCGEFRAVRDISINPLREDDLATLFKMMDAEGFSNFNRSTKRGDGGGAGASAFAEANGSEQSPLLGGVGGFESETN